MGHSGSGELPDAQELRRLLSTWTTGVCVVTSIGPDGAPFGKAVNSFHSVSMDPPLVGWCVDVASTNYAAWTTGPGYVVHILGEHQDDLVRRFARRGGDKFEGVEWAPGPMGLPLLDDAALRIVCRLWQTMPAGDHTYLVGEVVELQASDHRPLVFHGGRTRTLQQLFDEHVTSPTREDS